MVRTVISIDAYQILRYFCKKKHCIVVNYTFIMFAFYANCTLLIMNNNIHPKKKNKTIFFFRFFQTTTPAVKIPFLIPYGRNAVACIVSKQKN